jgi:hypothetical protein
MVVLKKKRLNNMKKRKFLKTLLSSLIAVPIVASTPTKKEYTNLGEWFEDNKTAKLRSIVESEISIKPTGWVRKNTDNKDTKIDISYYNGLEKNIVQQMNFSSILQTKFPRKPQIFRLEEREFNGSMFYIDFIDCLPPCLAHFRFAKFNRISIDGDFLSINDGVNEINFYII